MSCSISVTVRSRLFRERTSQGFDPVQRMDDSVSSSLYFSMGLIPFLLPGYSRQILQRVAWKFLFFPKGKHRRWKLPRVLTESRRGCSVCLARTHVKPRGPNVVLCLETTTSCTLEPEQRLRASFRTVHRSLKRGWLGVSPRYLHVSRFTVSRI